MANTESAGLTADAPPVRYRVSGMDCAKDAAQIERAVRGELAQVSARLPQSVAAESQPRAAAPAPAGGRPGSPW